MIEKPKVFISYCWTDQIHQKLVKDWADRLLSDGVEVMLDLYALKEGQDKNSFMERMVTDPAITHVLIICDKKYAEKSDSRKGGVGTESQIISQEVYEKVDQLKFIPIACQFDEADQPFLPTFFKSRIWINFSSEEEVNKNWEQLVRLLYGKPLHEKPKVGEAPVYITQAMAIPSNPAKLKFNLLRQAILEEKRGVNLYRQDFLTTCFDYADKLRIRQRPNLDGFGNRVLEDCGKLVVIRDLIVDWVLLETQTLPSEEFSEELINTLGQLRVLKSRPAEVNHWEEVWFEAHKIFAYETFLYIVAALLKGRAYQDLNNLFSQRYLIPTSEVYGEERFDRFDAFYAYSETLQSVLAPAGQRLNSAVAELLKRQSQRDDLPFSEIMQADLLTLMMSFITENTRWYPQTLYYSPRFAEFPFFIKATQHKDFAKLAVITGIGDVGTLRQAITDGCERLEVKKWTHFYAMNFAKALNVDRLNTI